MTNSSIYSAGNTKNSYQPGGNSSSNSAAEIDAAELLGREVIPLQSPASYAFLNNRIILVTGAAGSIGSELCRQLLDHEPALVLGLDTNETGLFDLAESLHDHRYRAHFRPHIGDITDIPRMDRLFHKERPHVVFHAAAYKHVPLLEKHSDQAIRTNALGTFHLCNLAQKYATAHFIFISTDKAANPTSIMGASKRFAELAVQSLASTSQGETCFCAVRFGNVIGSRGSVVPTFMRQIESGGPITITDAKATRYFMTIPEACGLVILAATLAKTSHTYLLDMGEPVRIVDLALKMIHAKGLKVGKDIALTYTGLRPGERLHEVLVAENEELTPTLHNKIFCVTCKDEAPSREAIIQWVQKLEDCLLEECDQQIRQYIFECVYQHNLVTVHA
jgi:FlaA1/EpsC-like NDP-sugar epimerase